MNVRKRLLHRIAFLALASCLLVAVTFLYPPSYVIDVWHMRTPQLEATLEQGDFVHCIAISPDGKILAAGVDESLYGGGKVTIKLWDLTGRRNTRDIDSHMRRISSLAFSPDGRVLASASYDEAIKLWDVASGMIAGIIKVPEGGHRLAFSPSGKIIASSAAGGSIKLYDLATGNELACLQGHSDPISSIAFSPDGTMLASTGFNDKSVKLWDVATRRNTHSITNIYPEPERGNSFIVYDSNLSRGVRTSVAFSLDGKAVASGEWMGVVRLWNLADNKEQVLRGDNDECGDDDTIVRFSPDGKTLASASYYEGKVNIWHVATGKRAFTIDVNAGYITGLAYSSDGKLLATGSDKVVKLWNMK